MRQGGTAACSQHVRERPASTMSRAASCATFIQCTVWGHQGRPAGDRLLNNPKPRLAFIHFRVPTNMLFTTSVLASTEPSKRARIDAMYWLLLRAGIFSIAMNIIVVSPHRRSFRLKNAQAILIPRLSAWWLRGTKPICGCKQHLLPPQLHVCTCLTYLGRYLGSYSSRYSPA